MDYNDRNVSCFLFTRAIDSSNYPTNILFHLPSNRKLQSWKKNLEIVQSIGRNWVHQTLPIYLTSRVAKTRLRGKLVPRELHLLIWANRTILLLGPGWHGADTQCVIWGAGRQEVLDCTNFSQRVANFATNWFHSLMQLLLKGENGHVGVRSGGQMHFLF